MHTIFAPGSDQWAIKAGTTSKHVMLSRGLQLTCGPSNATASRVMEQSDEVRLFQKPNFSRWGGVIAVVLCVLGTIGAWAAAIQLQIASVEVFVKIGIGGVIAVAVSVFCAWYCGQKAQKSRSVVFNKQTGILRILPDEIVFPAQEWVGIQFLQVYVPDLDPQGSHHSSAWEEVYLVRRHPNGKLERLFYASDPGHTILGTVDTPLIGCRWLSQWLAATGLPKERVVAVKLRIENGKQWVE